TPASVSSQISGTRTLHWIGAPKLRARVALTCRSSCKRSRLSYSSTDDLGPCRVKRAWALLRERAALLALRRGLSKSRSLRKHDQDLFLTRAKRRSPGSKQGDLFGAEPKLP